MCLETMMERVVALTLLCLQMVVGFNVDSRAPIVRTSVKGSYFGFSVAQHLIKTNDANEHVILVGAPQDSGTSSVFVRTGAVYQCPLLTQNEECTRLNIDSYAAEDPKKEDKSDQWLGVSVASANSEDSLAITCAHRYRKTGPGFVFGQGICFALENDLTDRLAVEPCSAKSTADIYYYIYCQVGTSSAINKNGTVLLGSPSAMSWRGTVFEGNVYELEKGEKIQEDDNTTLIRFDSLLGMSAKIGERIFENGKSAFIVGAPKSRGSGEVFIYQERGTNLTVVGRILGPKFYSGFGYEILVGDFNGDKKDDLIVGAPFYFEPGVGGAILIYFNSPDWGLSNPPVIITSRKMKDAECKLLNCHEARFGFSLANIGDLNKDGVEDFVVGAPFEGAGAIYIFHGSSSSKIASYSQRIAAAEVSGIQLRSFGYSLSGGGDVDGNSYSDLAVGSYQSDTVVILRARPIVSVVGGLESNPRQMDPKAKNCSADGKPVNCLRIKVCLQMTAEPKDKFQHPVNVKYRLEMEKFAGVSVVRMYFGDNQETYYTENLVSLQPRNNNALCKEHIAYLKPSNKDFYSAIAFRLTYELPDSTPPATSPNLKPPEFYSYPVLNASTASKELQVSFIKNCGKDDICNSSLKLSVNLQLPRVDGEYELNLEGGSQLVVNVSVSNLGEDAHEAVLRATLPPNVFLVRIFPKERSCIPADKVLECELGNPVVDGETVTLQIILNPDKLDASQNKIEIGFAVSTTSAEKDVTDDVVNVKIKVAKVIDLSVVGSSDPRGAYFSSTESQNSPIKNEEQIGQEILHKFQVTNIGSTVVSRSRLTITWPLRMVRSSTEIYYLLYIMERPTVQGNTRESEGARCEIDDKYINPLNVKAKESSPESLQKPTDAPKELRSRSPKRAVTGKAGLGNLICGRSSSIECVAISCEVFQLQPSESVLVKIRTRLWNRTLAAHFSDESELWVNSEATIAPIAGTVSNIRDQNTTNDVAQASTKLINSKASESVAIWIIVLAVCAGLLLLIIVIIVLWRLGFFKRRKPEFYPEHKASIVKSGEEEEERQQEQDMTRVQEIQ